MKRLVSVMLFLILSAATSLVAATPDFYLLKTEGIIDTALVDYITKGIEKAEKDGAQGVILEMQTPGGLDKSMRKIVEKILAAKVPVITYVSPKGSRAASAGAYILLSSHVAAMAEGTNIGTAHPVDFQGKSSSEKITNDAVAYIKNLARLKGRNEKWAAEAVLKNVSISEKEALKIKVIDIIAVDTTALVKQLNEKKIKTSAGEVKLKTLDAKTTPLPMSARQKFIHMLTDPNIVYVLFLIGIYGLIFELANAGTVVLPGIIGAISIVLAFTGFDSLPINTAGMLLIGLALILFFAEMITPAFGALGMGAIVAFILGSILLFPSRALGEEWAVSYMTMWIMIAVTVIFFIFVVAAVLKALRKKSMTGKESMTGLKGVAVTEIGQDAGVANVGGEEWQAMSEEKIAARELVEVLAVEGLKIKVKKIERKKEE
ncbi:MAG: nodulation protein NfeD [bacterium]